MNVIMAVAQAVMWYRIPNNPLDIDGPSMVLYVRDQLGVHDERYQKLRRFVQLK